MTKITPGTKYHLVNHDDAGHGQTLQFIHREPSALHIKGPKALSTVTDGTTVQEVLLAAHDRLTFVLGQVQAVKVLLAAHHVEIALNLLAMADQEIKEAKLPVTNIPSL